MFLAQLFDVGGARHPSIAIDSGGLLATVGWSHYYMDSHTGADYTSLQAVPCSISLRAEMQGGDGSLCRSAHGPATAIDRVQY